MVFLSVLGPAILVWNRFHLTTFFTTPAVISHYLFTSGYKLPAFVGIPQRLKVFSERQSKGRVKRVKLPPISFPRANQSVGVCFWIPDSCLKTDIY
ncbi:MAG: hypothetical protein ACJ8HJ_21355 [Massilia sp.]